ncbi:MAG TPA: ATP-binding protein [Myxococcaceae bacterium]|jgi:PAS domain S-box-containing protein
MSPPPEGGVPSTLPGALVRIMGLLQPRLILAEACRQAIMLCAGEAALAVAAAAGDRWTEDCYACSQAADDPGHLPPPAARAALTELQYQLAGAPGPRSAEPADPALAALVQQAGREAVRLWAVPLRDRDGAACGALAVLSSAPDAAERVCPVALAALGNAAETALANAAELGAARRHQERLLLFSDAVDEAIWDWNPVTQQVWWAAGIHTLLGPAAPAVEPAHAWKLGRIHPEDADRVRRELEAAAGAPDVSTWRAEYRFLRANGSWAHVEDRAHFLRDREGHALRAVGAMRDVSALRESAERLQVVAEVSRTLGHAALAPEHLYEAVARVVAERMGDSCSVRVLSPDGTQVQTAGFFHRDPELNERLREAVKVPGSALEGITGQVIGSRRRVLISRAGAEEMKRQMRPSALRDVLPADTAISLLATPIALRGRALGVLICTRRGPDGYTEDDATLLQALADRVALAMASAQQQDALRESEERLRLAAEATRLGTWELSAESRLITCDARCRELLWLHDGGAVPYDRLLQRIHPDHRARAAALLEAAEGGGGGEMRVELRTHREGPEHWIEVHARRTVSEVAPLHRLIGTMLDITERKRIERQLTEAVRARDEFLSIASHELRTPLTPMRLQLETLRRSLERAAPDERVLERLDVALRQAQRLSKLVENLLDVSRIASGRMSLELEQCDLAAVARDVAERFQDEAIRAGCPIELRLSEGATGLWDRSRLEQVATNLLSNAIKYGMGRPIEVAVSGEARSATVSVSDRGIGVEPEDAARIFRRFERAVPARHYGGLGLGLYIARQIAEAHGGQISVAGRPGGGSIFTVTLPRRPVDVLVEVSATSVISAGN